MTMSAPSSARAKAICRPRPRLDRDERGFTGEIVIIFHSETEISMTRAACLELALED